MHAELSSLLAQWHQWRSHFSPERGYARARFAVASDAEEDEELEAMQMRSIEDAIASLPALQQLALQHVARAECLGVEVIRVSRLPANPRERDLLCTQALMALQRKLLAQGVL